MMTNDILAAVRWWAMLLIIGTAAIPLTFYIFNRLPDRGYAFVKMVGLLIISFLFWFLGSLGLLGNNVGGILFSLLGMLLLSIWANRRQSGSALKWLRENKSQVLLTEFLFVLVFALWVWVRAQNPVIANTEKPMEFAFLNAIGRSPSFPPLDPWMSNFAISYYYFGYVMTSVIARLSFIPGSIAFNLAIAWLMAGTAVSAFGLVYNLVASGNSRRAALTLGLVAALAIPIAGNLEIGLEILHANGKGSDAFWDWLDVRDLNRPATVTDTPRYETSSWWWWRSSRVIHEYHLSGRAEEGLEPIIEFPAFSFVLGDMHPHVLALPFAFLSLALAFVWYLEEEPLDTTDWKIDLNELRASTNSIISLLPNRPLWAFSVLLLGGLSFLNTWDVLIHLFILLGAIVLNQWRKHGWHNRILSQAFWVALLLIIPSILLYFPFYTGFRSQAGPPFLLPMLMRPSRLSHFLIIFGMPLWTITILLGCLALRQRLKYWRTGIQTAVFIIGGLLLLMLFLGWIIASSSEGAGRVISLAEELNVTLPVRPTSTVAFGWGISAILTLSPIILRVRLNYLFLTLFLSGMLGLVTMIWLKHFSNNTSDTQTKSSANTLPFVLLLIGTAALLTIGPEFVYIRDNFGLRLNTIFKFYYQAWVLFGVSALFALGYLWQEMKIGAQRLLPMIATVGYGALLITGLMFPYHAISSRALEFRSPDQPPTLDGLAQMRRFHPDEYEAIMWLNDNISGTPVILEAVGGQYTEYGRVSASTGMPTVLGWAGHELQWRGSSNPEPGLRDPAVRQIYSEGNWENTANLLDQYKVEYIYVGRLEKNSYGQQLQEKFDDRMEIAFRNDNVTIYHWQPR